jgi:tetratricopeptide (TPR) repeat protein
MINKRQFLNALIVSQNITHSFLKIQTENDIYSQLKENLIFDNDENSFIKEFIEHNLSENKFGYNLLVQIAKIREEGSKPNVLDIAIELLEQMASTYEYEGQNDSLLSSVIVQLVKYWGNETAFEIVNKIYDPSIQSSTFLDIAMELRRKGNIDESKMFILKSIDSGFYISNERIKNKSLSAISKVISKQGDSEQALSILNYLNDNFIKVDTLLTITNDILSEKNYRLIESLVFEALNDLKKVSSKYSRVILLVKVYYILFNIGKIEQANDIITEAINLSDAIKDNWENSNSKIDIVRALSSHGYNKHAFKICLLIADEDCREDAFKNLFLETFNQDKTKEILVLLESLENMASKELFFMYFIETLLKVTTIENACEIILNLKFVKINDNYLKKIILLLFENGSISKAINLLFSINDVSIKNSAIHILCINFAKVGNVTEIEQLLYDVIDPLKKSTIQHDVALELAKNSFINAAILIANQIELNRTKNIVLEQIVFELHKLNNWEFAKEITLSINQAAIRHNCWKNFGSQNIRAKGLLGAINDFQNYISKEAQFYYLKGWAESISVNDINNELVNKAIHALMNDSSSLENFLQVYVRHELIFGNPSDEKMNRLNQTLNIQWVQDIMDQFSKKSEIS